MDKLEYAINEISYSIILQLGCLLSLGLMFLLLLSLLWELAKFILAKLLAKFASNNNKKKKLPEGPIHLPTENMVDIFAFISRPKIDQCELVNQRFRAIIERHKNKLPTLKMDDQKKCRMKAFIRWKRGLIWAKTSLVMDICFAIHWIMVEFFAETKLVIPYFLLLAFIFLYWVNKWDFNYFYYFCFEAAFPLSIIPLLLIYTNQSYLYSIRYKIYLAFSFPLILIQSHNLYKIQYFDGPPKCRKKLD